MNHFASSVTVGQLKYASPHHNLIEFFKSAEDQQHMQATCDRIVKRHRSTEHNLIEYFKETVRQPTDASPDHNLIENFKETVRQPTDASPDPANSLWR